LGVIAGFCLAGEEGADVAREVCGKLRDAASDYTIRPFQCDDLLHNMLRAQPGPALDGLFCGDHEQVILGIRFLREASWRRNPLDVMPEHELLSWCNEAPESRYAILASVITLHERSGPSEPLQWTKKALALLESAPEPRAILDKFVDQMTTPEGGWIGSASPVSLFLPLLDELRTRPRLHLVIEEQRRRILQKIEQDRELEINLSRMDERFE
jgi:hypothetical protein